jgi:hypothetical protein
MTFVYWDIDEGAALPRHAHHHEQVVNMLEGEFELVVAARRIASSPATCWRSRQRAAFRPRHHPLPHPRRVLADPRGLPLRLTD